MLKDTYTALLKQDKTSGIIKIPFIMLQLTAGKILMKYGKRTKKHKKIIIFTNLYYTGNTRAVYERMLERTDLKDRYDVYWMTSNIKEYIKMKRDGLPVIYKHGLIGVRIYRDADLWVLAHLGRANLPIIMHNKYRELKKIQLGHGVGPKATKGVNREYDLFDATCLSSEFIRNRHITLWNAPPEKLFVTGFARLDLLLKYLNKPKSQLLKQLRLPQHYKKVILYAPTYDLGIWPWGDPVIGLGKLAKFLDVHKSLLLVRPHPYSQYDMKQIKKLVKLHDNIVMVPMSKYPDTQLLLAVTDLLITDWSSIYTDFLITKRPIIFIEVNKKYFLKERGESEVPPELRPGIRVKNEREFYSALEMVLNGNYVLNSEFYEKCLWLIHGRPDGHYSDRVIKVIEKVLKDDL